MFDEFDLSKIRKPFPSLGMLVVGVLVVGASHRFESSEVVAPLKQLTDYVLQRSLEPPDALTLGTTSYSELTECEGQGPQTVCKPRPSDAEILMQTQRGDKQPGLLWSLRTAILNVGSSDQPKK